MSSIKEIEKARLERIKIVRKAKRRKALAKAKKLEFTEEPFLNK